MTARLRRFLPDIRLTRERGGAALLALLVEALIALALFYFLSPMLPRPKEIVPMSVFGIDTPKGAPNEVETSKPASKARPHTAERRRAVDQPEVRPPVPVPVPIATPDPVPPGEPTFLKLSRNDYRASDIGKVTSHADSGTGEDAGRRGAAGRSDDAIGIGPNGESLYAAEWYRRPTQAELNTYLSRRALDGEGWGQIICRIVKGYRVEDCQEEAESPRGSGWAGSARQAAWQFRVRPPRRNGEELWDVWVRIRIDYRMLRR